MQWTAFLTYVLITCHTPGPTVILGMNTARLHGIRKTLPLIAGMSSGLFIIMLCCAAFNLLLARLLPSVLPVLRVGGAAYIFWLAWKIAFPKIGVSEGKELPPPLFREGLLLQFLNPKVILLGLTTLSTFILPWTSSPAWVFGCSISLALLCTNGVFLWALLGAAQKRIMPAQGRFWDLLMGGLLAWCAFSVSGLKDILL